MTIKLREEIDRFRTWASHNKPQSAEWETEYPDWESLYETVEATFSTEQPLPELAPSLLYVLARDNEGEHVLDLLGKHPHWGIALAEAGVDDADSDARWQLAGFLGGLRTPRALQLLRRFAADPEEYVRRRALLAIKGIDPEFARKYAKTVDIDIFSGDEA